MRTKFLRTPEQHRQVAARLRIVDPYAPLLETLDALDHASALEQLAAAIEKRWAAEDRRDAEAAE